MNRLNKITLKKELAPKPRVVKVPPVFLAVNAAKGFNMSRGLYDMLEAPEFIEFLEEPGKLYIMVSDAECGFKVNGYAKFSNFSFCARPIAARFFNDTRQRAVVFTEPKTAEINGQVVKYYEIRLPQ